MNVQNYDGAYYAPESQIDRGLEQCIAPNKKSAACQERLAALLSQLSVTSDAILTFSSWGDAADLAALIARKAALEILTGDAHMGAEVQAAQEAALLARGGPETTSAAIKETLDDIQRATTRARAAPTNTALPGHISSLKLRLFDLSGLSYREYCAAQNE